jgi:hypothetical protein
MLNMVFPLICLLSAVAHCFVAQRTHILFNLGPNTDVHEMAVACQIEYNIVTAV